MKRDKKKDCIFADISGKNKAGKNKISHPWKRSVAKIAVLITNSKRSSAHLVRHPCVAQPFEREQLGGEPRRAGGVSAGCGAPIRFRSGSAWDQGQGTPCRRPRVPSLTISRIRGPEQMLPHNSQACRRCIRSTLFASWASIHPSLWLHRLASMSKLLAEQLHVTHLFRPACTKQGNTSSQYPGKFI